MRARGSVYLCSFMFVKKEATRGDLLKSCGLGRQLLSSALTPSLEYEAAAFRLHALTESMCLFSPMIVGLVGSLHLSSPPSSHTLRPCHCRAILMITNGHYRRSNRALSRRAGFICGFFSNIVRKPLLISALFFAKISPTLCGKPVKKTCMISYFPLKSDYFHQRSYPHL